MASFEISNAKILGFYLYTSITFSEKKNEKVQFVMFKEVENRFLPLYNVVNDIYLPSYQKLYELIFFFNISEFYYQSGISAEEYQHELEYQLRKTTLGISVGLVKEFDEHENHGNEDSIDSKRSKYFNPYSHFARNANDDRSVVKKIDNHATKRSEENIHEYKICEIRPPSIEKV